MSEVIKDEKSIKIKVVPSDSKFSTLVFQVKYSTTKMQKVIDAFVAKHDVSAHSYRFCFNGKSFSGEHTAKQLEMQDGDEIDVFLPQTAGWFNINMNNPLGLI